MFLLNIYIHNMWKEIKAPVKLVRYADGTFLSPPEKIEQEIKQFKSSVEKLFQLFASHRLNCWSNRNYDNF